MVGIIALPDNCHCFVVVVGVIVSVARYCLVLKKKLRRGYCLEFHSLCQAKCISISLGEVPPNISHYAVAFTIFHLHPLPGLCFPWNKVNHALCLSDIYNDMQTTPLLRFLPQLGTESLFFFFLEIIGIDLREYINCKIPPFFYSILHYSCFPFKKG